jgi:hypothetical protein
VKDKVEHVVNQVGQQTKLVVSNGVKAIQENETVKQGVEQVGKVVEQASDKVRELKEQSTAPVNGGGGKKKKNKKSGGNKTPPTPAAATSSQKPEDKGDDMRDHELEPRNPPARVIKIVGGEIGADPEQVRKENAARGGETVEDGWEKPDAFEEDDGEWESVVSKSQSFF